MPSVSFVGANTGTTLASLPAGWAAGDLALVFAFRDGNTTAPTLPTGWTNVTTGSNSTGDARSFRVGRRTLQSGDTAFGTWANATSVVGLVYRSALGIGATTFTSPSTTTSTGTASLTLNQLNGSSYVIAFIGHTGNTPANLLGGSNVPSGMTQRALVTDTTDTAGAFDTLPAGGATSNYSTSSVTWTAGDFSGHVVLLELRGAFISGQAGSITATGALEKKLARAVGGAVTAAGALVASLLPGGQVFFVALAGAITAAGALARKTARTLDGAVTAAGAVAKKLARPLAGAVTAAGAVAKKFGRALAGAVTAAGALEKKLARALAGSIAAAGAVAKKLARPLAGAVTAAGALEKKLARALAGSIAAAGALASRVLVVYQVALAGSIAAAGALSATFLGAVAAVADWLRTRRRRRR